MGKHFGGREGLKSRDKGTWSEALPGRGQDRVVPGVTRGGGGVLRISTERDDRMGTKIKSQKPLGIQTKPKQTPGPKLNLPKIPCRFSEP